MIEAPVVEKALSGLSIEQRIAVGGIGEGGDLGGRRRLQLLAPTLARYSSLGWR